MASRKKDHLIPLPQHSRLVAPVLGSTGGAGRSVAAGLLAWGLSIHGTAVVLDTAGRSASPWPAWSPRAGPGLAAVPPDRPASRGQVMTAAARFTGPTTDASTGGQWDVLTDHQSWDKPLLDLPTNPGAWYQLAAIGGWQAAVADTRHAATEDLLIARHTRTASVTAGWYGLPYSIPVWCAPATGPGIEALQVAVSVALASGLPVRRTVIALVSIGEGRLPARVQAAETMLAPMVADVVQIPFDSHIRSHGLASAPQLRTRTRQAASALAAAVMQAAHAAFGEPLPPAPQPTTLRASPPQPSDSSAPDARSSVEVPA